jgi:hypothetical protein
LESRDRSGSLSPEDREETPTRTLEGLPCDGPLDPTKAPLSGSELGLQTLDQTLMLAQRRLGLGRQPPLLGKHGLELGHVPLSLGQLLQRFSVDLRDVLVLGADRGEGELYAAERGLEL